VRVVITGATGNVGTSLLRSLIPDPRIGSILGLARRAPSLRLSRTEWRAADVARDDLRPHFDGADAVVHLAWIIQPSRDPEMLRRVNVLGSERVFRAVGDAGVRTLVHASSVGAYSPGPKDPPVDESWPTDGVVSSFYSRHKAEAERLLDAFESEHPNVRVVRLRPGLIFKRSVGAEVRRLFIGPFVPNVLVRRYLIPAVPHMPRLEFQAVHSHDVGEAYRLALTRDVRGAFNVAADPVLTSVELARLLAAKPIGISPRVVRSLVDWTWRLHLQPTPAGWIDLALQSPIMNTHRARRELGWRPTRTSGEALLELLSGVRRGAGLDTPPLSPSAGGPLRIRELLSGVGAR
jgi:UDP-glucose 4-epimerase